MTARIPTPEERRELAERIQVWLGPGMDSVDKVVRYIPGLLRALEIAEAALEEAGCQYVDRTDPGCLDLDSGQPLGAWCCVCAALAKLRGGS